MRDQRTIGLIGGMSWESSALYYRLINEGVRTALGGTRSARILMLSFDFGEIEEMQHAGRWDALADMMADSALRLERAGADCLALCTNTMHRVAGAVEAAARVPLLHIGDATGARVRAAGCRRVGLLGTAFTMEQDFYAARLRDRFGLDVIVPEAAERALVHRIIYDELVQGRVEAASRAVYRAVIDGLVARGAQGVILGCTEITLLIGRDDSAVPLFDTTAIHAQAAVDHALGRSG